MIHGVFHKIGFQVQSQFLGGTWNDWDPKSLTNFQ